MKKIKKNKEEVTSIELNETKIIKLNAKGKLKMKANLISK